MGSLTTPHKIDEFCPAANKINNYNYRSQSLNGQHRVVEHISLTQNQSEDGSWGTVRTRKKGLVCVSELPIFFAAALKGQKTWKLWPQLTRSHSNGCLLLLDQTKFKWKQRFHNQNDFLCGKFLNWADSFKGWLTSPCCTFWDGAICYDFPSATCWLGNCSGGIWPLKEVNLWPICNFFRLSPAGGCCCRRQDIPFIGGEDQWVNNFGWGTALVWTCRGQIFANPFFATWFSR